MEYRRLGSTNVRVSRIGFGCWAIGGHGYGIVDDKSSFRAIRHALDLGINFFDTADVYGFGHSEEVLAEALGPKRKDVIVATKFGILWDDKGNTYRDIDPKRVLQALEDSLGRLKMDCIPLYQIHWPDEQSPIEDVIEALLKCRDAGKIMHIGCCNFPQDLLVRACGKGGVESYQCLFNLARREHEHLIKYSSEKLGLAIMPYSVIGRGIFSGKYDSLSKFQGDDTRSKDVDFQGSRYHKNIMISEDLGKIGKKYGKPSAQVAIRWVLENPYVTCALIGIKNKAQVSENVGAIGWTLDRGDMKLIDSLVSDRTCNDNP